MVSDIMATSTTKLTQKFVCFARASLKMRLASLHSAQRAREKERNDAATYLQIKYRTMIQVKRARTKLLRMKRRLINPFKEISNISTLVTTCLKKSDKSFSSHNAMCGVDLAQFCQRIGVLGDVYPVISKNNVHDTRHLFKLSDSQLKHVGINEEIKGDRHKGILHAETVRKVILALGDIGRDNIPEADRTEEQQQLYNDFKFLSHVPQLKAVEIKKIFEGVYGEKFASRANHFAQGPLLKIKLTTLQLKRFFNTNETPGKAKEHSNLLLTNGDPPCLSDLLDFDVTRIEKCADVCLYACEQLESMIKDFPNLYYKFHSAVLTVQGDTQKKKKEQMIENGPTLAMVRTHLKRDKENCELLFYLLNGIREMDGGARVVQVRKFYICIIFCIKTTDC